MTKKSEGPEPEQSKQAEPPEPEPEEEPGGHQVVTDGDVDLPVPPLQAPEPFTDGVDTPEEQLPETVMPFTGDDEGKGSN